jgi:hypothetical protein
MPTEPANGVGRVIDPTKNVLDLVEAAIRRQDDLREAEAKYQNYARDAEAKRTDQLLAQARAYDERIANMLAKSVETSSGLLSTALSEMRAQLGVRISELERFRYETSGKSGGFRDGWGWLIGIAALALPVVLFILK